jgi:hypothetical protein
MNGVVRRALLDPAADYGETPLFRGPEFEIKASRLYHIGRKEFRRVRWSLLCGAGRHGGGNNIQLPAGR